MGLEMGKPFEVVARFSVVDACLKLEDTFHKVHDLAKTPLEGSCNVSMHEESPTLGCESVLTSLLDHSHASPLCSLPFSFP